MLHEIIAWPPQNLECRCKVHVLIHTDIVVDQGSFIPGVDQEVIGHTCMSKGIIAVQGSSDFQSVRLLPRAAGVPLCAFCITYLPCRMPALCHVQAGRMHWTGCLTQMRKHSQKHNEMCTNTRVKCCQD